jgi:hypothetical protein
MLRAAFFKAIGPDNERCWQDRARSCLMSIADPSSWGMADADNLTERCGIPRQASRDDHVSKPVVAGLPQGSAGPLTTCDIAAGRSQVLNAFRTASGVAS